MSGSAARNFEDEPEYGRVGGSSTADEVADALDGIDWSDLQDFFFQHLRGEFDAMEQHLRRGDLAAIGRIGHGIKGSGGGVGLPRFTVLGKHLEEAGKGCDPEAVRAACRALRAEYLTHHPEEGEALGDYFGGC